MSELKYVIALALFAIFAAPCLGHTYHLGSCPIVEPMHGFEMNKMLGVWYVIQKTSTASHCLTYNFTRGEEPGEYELEQASQHFILGLTPLKHDYKYTGKLVMNDPSVPANMRIRFPLSVGGSASYIVFMSDYDKYAAIFTCQKLTFAHRQSATILSRTKELDKMYVDKIRSRLSSFGVDPFDLSIISQKDCPKHENGTGLNIDIDPDTFSAQNIAGVVRKAGEKIGEGVEYVAETGKKVYNKLAHSKEETGQAEPTKDKERLESSSREFIAGNHRYYPKHDAEWLP